MNPQNLSDFTRESLITDARSIGIKNPHRLTDKELTDIFYWYNQKVESFKTRKSFNRKDLEKIVKKQNLTKSDYMKAAKLNKFSQEDLQKIAGIRKIKNVSLMDKEQLIYTLLRTTKNNREAHYIQIHY